MMKRQWAAWLWGILGLAWGLSGCAKQSASPTPGAASDATRVYQTVEFRLTQAHLTLAATSPTSSATSSTTLPTTTATGRPLPLSTASPTNQPVNTQARLCDHAAPGNPIDVTIPDDTEMVPGQSFTKIWRLQNIGACTWTTSYAVRFFYGAQMSAPEEIPLRQAVAPGESVEIAIDMVAPLTPGVYQGNWKLRNAAGQLFGIGPNGNAHFWVRINVIRLFTSTPTPTVTFTTTPSPTPTLPPTLTPTPTGAVQVSGRILLLSAMTLNLDTGEVNPETGKDLLFQTDADNLHHLVPQETAALGIFGATEPGLADCRQGAMSKAGLALESLPVNTYLCYRTDQGLYGWLRYLNLSTTDHSALIEFLTWAILAP